MTVEAIHLAITIQELFAVQCQGIRLYYAMFDRATSRAWTRNDHCTNRGWEKPRGEGESRVLKPVSAAPRPRIWIGGSRQDFVFRRYPRWQGVRQCDGITEVKCPNAVTAFHVPRSPIHHSTFFIGEDTKLCSFLSYCGPEVRST